MKVMIIVVTHQRTRLLKTLLQSIDAAQIPASMNLNLTFGINGADPDAEIVLADQQKKSRMVLSYQVFQSRLDPSLARQKLLDQVTENWPDWFCFLDDDVILPANYFSIFSEVNSRLPAASFIGGPNLTPEENGSFEKASGLVLSSPIATGPFSKRYHNGGQGKMSRSDAPFILCNLWVKSDVLRVLRFPNTVGGGEENEILLEGFRLGRFAYFEPELWLWHHRRANLSSFTIQIMKYGRGRGNIIRAKYPSLLFKMMLLVLIAVIIWILGQLSIMNFFFLAGSYLTVTAAGTLKLAILAKKTESQSLGQFRWLFSVWALFSVIHVSYLVGLIFGYVWKKAS